MYTLEYNIKIPEYSTHYEMNGLVLSAIMQPGRFYKHIYTSDFMHNNNNIW